MMTSMNACPVVSYFLFSCNLFGLNSALRIAPTSTIQTPVSMPEGPSSSDFWDNSTLVPWPEKPTPTDFLNFGKLTSTDPAVSANHQAWIHHHIWKCGGTNLCDIAQRNGESIQHDDPGVSRRCDIQNTPENARRFSFAVWQLPMGALQLDYFLQSNRVSVMMRDPMNQVLSHYHHSMQVFGRYNHSTNETIGQKQKIMTLLEWIDFGICRQREGVNLHPVCVNDWLTSMKGRNLKDDAIEYAQSIVNTKKFGHWFFLFEDNMQTRWISGAMHSTDVRGVGKFHSADRDQYESSKSDYIIGEKELSIAKANMAKYTDIFILEKFDSRDKARLATKLGWKTDLTSHMLGTNRRSDAEKELTSDEIEYVKRFVQQDLQLYDFAKKLASTFSQRFKSD
eukprot:gnl/MRDRNA2_/MRDRNA2_86533_c0_seq2.p1 gnl/MRDRNA2_/MRDRNA2_86533_c0~~gnl/MRDRNA2_/MRDRNA2_86533_c0_seq2.p1  ORF type:complete len:395 (+),score=49.75 gnl/MRDRNA2_/MRDRNA2_86533_c0_seq2:122-1306(+)